MKFIQGINRDQIYLFPVSLEESIGQDNVVRAVDVFVESLPFKELGFKVDFVENGRPAYHPMDLLKLLFTGI
jgi:transposase